MTEKWASLRHHPPRPMELRGASSPAAVVVAAIAIGSRVIGPPICTIVASLTLFLTTLFPPE